MSDLKVGPENTDQVCTRCGAPRIMLYLVHTRLYGYQCICGNQEWKDRDAHQPHDLEYVPGIGYILKVKQ